MKKETLVWIVLFVAGGCFLAYRATTHGMAYTYVRPVNGRNVGVQARESITTGTTISTSRTLGVWLGAFFTLCIFSFLYRDNPFYKLAEALLIGISAAYWMVVSLWEVLVPNLFG